MPSFFVEVSFGELLDKYSILEIKASRIQEEEKLKCVRDELEALAPQVSQYMTIVETEYLLLKRINQVIWDLNDEYCQCEAFDGKKIMEENNARFRIKRKINQKIDSRLKEVKNYQETTTFVDATSGQHPTDVLVLAESKLLYFDKVYIKVNTDDPNIEMYKKNESFYLSFAR